MTALNQYQRLEASGLWRAEAGAQRREVIASIGDATLLISDMQDRPLTHWSIPAIERANPGKFPAVFHPFGDADETLELAEDQHEMIDAIEKLRRAIHRHEPRPGRLRSVVLGGSLLAMVAGAVFWLPDALRGHVTKVMPDLNRTVIGQDILGHLSAVTGTPCRKPALTPTLKRLAERVGAKEIIVVPSGIRSTAALPGKIILLSRAVLEDTEDPAVAIGYLVAESLRMQQNDPLEKLLETGGISASFRLLTTAELTPETLKAFSETLASSDPAPLDMAALAAHFNALRLPATPYAYAVDISGETTIDLIEADAVTGVQEPVLKDGTWVALQEICST
ncbi:hypothetical protein N6L24_00380 [Cognatishimia sp. SS12]|uniref:hypothetical protein n=1 Tax=Cognatishimia sp. SS12 TaxID=2979465 RepID=UPI00232FD2C1|nr:hypothetical protein [Cognatishimia sp. SS12]MDC0736721.1 hypothetical protein [Cognatishimia sp. SS12]